MYNYYEFNKSKTKPRNFKFDGVTYTLDNGNWYISGIIVLELKNQLFEKLLEYVKKYEIKDNISNNELISYADAYKDLGAYNVAIYIYETVIEKPDCPMSTIKNQLSKISSCYRLLDEPEKSIRKYNKYKEDYEESVLDHDLYTSVAAAYLDINDLKVAKEFIELAHNKLGPNKVTEHLENVERRYNSMMTSSNTFYQLSEKYIQKIYLLYDYESNTREKYYISDSIIEEFEKDSINRVTTGSEIGKWLREAHLDEEKIINQYKYKLVDYTDFKIDHGKVININNNARIVDSMGKRKDLEYFVKDPDWFILTINRIDITENMQIFKKNDNFNIYENYMVNGKYDEYKIIYNKDGKIIIKINRIEKPKESQKTYYLIIQKNG